MKRSSHRLHHAEFAHSGTLQHFWNTGSARRATTDDLNARVGLLLRPSFVSLNSRVLDRDDRLVSKSLQELEVVVSGLAGNTRIADRRYGLPSLWPGQSRRRGNRAAGPDPASCRIDRSCRSV